VFNHHLYSFFFVFLFIFFVSGCSQNEDQRKFEQEAFQLPDGITQTNGRGEIVNDNVDPDDWRIAPFFQGLVIVDPAFPNPVMTNQQLAIRVHLPFIENITHLDVYVLRNLNDYQFLRRQTAMTLVDIILDPLDDIAQFSENPLGLYRIIIFDNNDNVITYGDIEIE